LRNGFQVPLLNSGWMRETLWIIPIPHLLMPCMYIRNFVPTKMILLERETGIDTCTGIIFFELSKLVVHEYYYRNEDPRTDARKDSILDTWAKVMSHEIQRVRNESELGIIAQLQQSTWCRLFKDEYGITDLDTNYEGEEAVRAMPEITQIYENETFSQKVIFIGNGSITDPTMYYREIGSTDTFSTAMLLPIGNSTTVMKAELDDPGYDFEYYIQGSIGGETVTYPVTGGNEVSLQKN